jgi:hypothetical protein
VAGERPVEGEWLWSVRQFIKKYDRSFSAF